MADTKISGLTAAAAAAAANELAINEAGASKKVTLAQISGFFSPWEGKLAAAYGDGDPRPVLLSMQRAGNISPTPTNITASIARISYFRLHAALTVNKIRYFGVGATTTIYRIAIYNGDTRARLLTETAFTTTAGTWGAIGSSLGLALAAGQLYFLAVSVNTTGTTPGVLAFGGTVSAIAGQIAVLPKSYPGNLSVDSSVVAQGFGDGAVTSGALPDPFPTVAIQSAWTGGMPAFFLDNSNA